MTKDKRKRRREARQRVSLLAYLLPSLAASTFELEAPLPVEEAAARLERLQQVRISRSLSLFRWLLAGLFAGRDALYMPDSISAAPMAVRLEYLDDDTYRYQMDVSDDLFRIQARGYLKRWEPETTLVTGEIAFDVHYAGFLLRTLVALVIIALALALAALLLRYMVNVWWLLFDLTQAPPSQLAGLGGLLWAAAAAILWLNDVVAPAHDKRHRLVTRVEDLLLFGLFRD